MNYLEYYIHDVKDSQQLRFDILRECGFDFDKAQKAFEWIMGTSEESPSVKKNCGQDDDEGATDLQYDYVGNFHEGFARVRLNSRWNFINTEGKLISETWFDCVNDFSEGLARVTLKGKYNFIALGGEYLSDTWFERATYFSDGCAIVTLNGETFYIDKQGKRI